MMDQTHIGYTSWDEPKQGNIMPEVKHLSPNEARQGGYIFSDKCGVVVMEAEHYFEGKAGGKTKWTVIPGLGRTFSGIALMPYTEQTSGSSLTYKMKLNSKSDSVKLRMIFNSTLPFSSRGNRIAASFDNGKEKIWNINDQLTWKNNYSKMYPAGAARIIETETILPLAKTTDGMHELTIKPLDPGVVFEKVTIDDGGYENTFLKMTESPYQRH